MYLIFHPSQSFPTVAILTKEQVVLTYWISRGHD
jgi:hypothetical protein